MFQSTRPRGARHSYTFASAAIGTVSIHAPARGATEDCEKINFEKVVSIHAPARGATTLLQTYRLVVMLFQSTRPRGARPGSLTLQVKQGDVSIHAPARGATKLESKDKGDERFQSTRPRGARRASRRLPIFMWTFQSTRPRGARRASRRLPIFMWTFQSTRPRGARPVRVVVVKPCLFGFNPRAREGRDRFHPARPSPRSGFNPRAREGRDLLSRIGSALTISFQSTRPRGARHRRLRRRRRRAKVSIHAPARGATESMDAQTFTRCRFNPRAREGRDAARTPAYCLK